MRPSAFQKNNTKKRLLSLELRTLNERGKLMADHPVDPRDHEPFGDRAFDDGKPKKCPTCPGNDVEGHKLSCTSQGAGQLKLPATITPDGRVKVTTSGRPPEPGTEGTGAPGKIDPTTGQHTQYWVLSPEERAKGFVEPARRSYKHVGIAGPKHPVRPLTDEEQGRYKDIGYTVFEEYPPGHESAARGRYWTADQLNSVGKGCGAVTSMGSAIAETYARLPEFYGSTFCVNCGVHLPVGKDGEFIWENTKQRVGTRAPTEEMGWEPYVPEPLKDISEMLAKRDGRHRVKRVTVKLEMEGALKDGAELVIDAVEGTELFMNLNMRAGNRKVPQPDGSSKFEGTGELDYSLEIYRRKV